MAVIVSNGATNLSTASGFYRAESYNLSPFSTTILALNTARQINVTFANAGNCKGLILHLYGSGTNKDVTVELQENTGSWTTRASKTLTTSDITLGGSIGLNCSGYIKAFEFATPYAVDTTASKWRFNITQGTGNAYNWNIKTSNGTAPSYVTWCDNAVSYATNDVIVAKETITIDQDCTFKGLLSTGDSTNSICAIACTSTTRDPTANGMIVWDDTPASSYTMNIDGFMVLSAYAGFYIGNSTNRIPYAQKAVVNIKNATSGTVTNTGISQGGNASHANYIGKASFQLYGEVPTTRVTTLASDANFNQKNIVTTDTTGWAVGDKLVVCKADMLGATAETVPFTIDTISGTNITLLENLTTAKRLAGGHIFRVNGYGVEMSYEGATALTLFMNGANRLYFDGVYMTKTQFNLTNGTSEWNDSLANITEVQVIDCSFVNGSGIGVLGYADLPVTIERNHYFRTTPTSTIYGPATALKKIKDCLFYGGVISGWFRNSNGLVENNYFYNNQNQAFGNGGLSSAIFRNNYIWGCGTAGSFRNDGPMVDVLFENNVWNYTPLAIYNFSVMIDVVFRNETFGNEKALNYIFGSFAGYSPFSKVLFENCNYGTLSYTQTYADQNGVDGSQVRFQNWDGTNNDATFMPYGSITRTGTGLSDTTVRTAGGFAMRFEPTYSPNLMHWEQIIPTGNIQSKTMTVSLWVKINNAAYYAGTHTKPTLTIDYDNGTTMSSVATTGTDWQQLAVTFTPVTTYGQIEMKVTGATDATGTNRYFYVDDVNIAYPAGVAIDLGNLDLWAEGLPVAPAIATMPSLGGVWDEPLTAHTIAGSAGVVVGEILSNTDATQAKVNGL